MAVKLTPYQARIHQGLSCKDVADLSGLAYTTIRNIESTRTDFCINISTAEIVAETLGVPVDTIDWPRPLSSRGRPPLTGGPKQSSVRRQPVGSSIQKEIQLCSNCSIVQVPIDNRCSCCGY